MPVCGLVTVWIVAVSEQEQEMVSAALYERVPSLSS
jgi:hypothetical protein